MKLRVVIRHASASKIFEVTKQSHCVIGRKDADITLSDPRISTHHAIIYEAFNGDLRIKDLNSRNGTHVNGKRITDCALHVEDEIRIGKIHLNILDYESTSRRELPPAVNSLMDRKISERLKDTVTSTQVRKTPVIRQWPENIYSLPKDRQKKFEKYMHDSDPHTPGKGTVRSPKKKLA